VIGVGLFLLYALALSAGLQRAGLRRLSPRPRRFPGSSPKRILIVGATGGTGRELVRQALERGYEVTVLVRSPPKVDLRHPALTILQGNVLDAASVDAAVRGQEAVLCALGHKRLFFQPTTILSRGTRNLLRSMETNAVPRLVCETSLGIGDSAWRMGLSYSLFVIPVVLQFYFWDKTRQERAIASSSRDWVVVRPGALTNGPARGDYRHGSGVGSFLRTVRISRADVAGFMLRQLVEDTCLGTSPGVAG
jgi:nucleoside-diphosphate-sugar epimerase